MDFLTHAARALAVNPPHATDFSVRARIAHLGLVPGRDFDPGRFDADALPPAGAFWSVTMYDGEGFQAANEINRFALAALDGRWNPPPVRRTDPITGSVRPAGPGSAGTR